jgi:hypothetical protein
MLLAAILMQVTVPAGRAQEAGDSDRVAVLASVQQFFGAMAERDVEAARKVVLGEGRVFSVRYKEGEPVLGSFTFQENHDSWATRSRSFLERVWNSEVRIHDRIATVWTPYDFHIDGEFSHCGVSVSNLVKTPEGWKMTGGVYTVETESCPESPLGSPQTPTER